jgi:hypothetical protein
MFHPIPSLSQHSAPVADGGTPLPFSTHCALHPQRFAVKIAPPMPDATPATPVSPSATGVMAKAPGDTVEIDPVWEERQERMRLLMETNLPDELRKLATDLMHSLRHNAGVAERFDAFCVQAFSKPDWAVPASAVIGELFENEEDRLAELARVPDLVIELGCGQAAIACTVASKWATRGETHRLSRLAESIIAAQGTMRNPAAVEVMLALSATLAITRPSRAEQLFNAALPLAAEEHAEAVADARRWLATGRILASGPQEMRDMWDNRLRRPRVAWKWDSAEELKALRFLAGQIEPDMASAALFQKVTPAAWWEVVIEKAKAEAHWKKEITAAREGQPAPVPAQAPAEPEPPRRRPSTSLYDDDAPLAVTARASSVARFVLGWAVGVFFMGFTFFLAPDAIYRLIKGAQDTLKPAAPAPAASSKPATAPAAVPAPAPSEAPKTPASPQAATPPPEVPQGEPVISGKAWREAQAQKFARHNEAIANLFASIKQGDWNKNQMLLSGHDPILPFSDEKYLQLLVWLHLDPPPDAETCRNLPRLLLERADSSVLAVWEGVLYPGSPNAEDIRRTAREIYKEKATIWSAEDAERLRLIAEQPDAPATGTPKP